METHADQTPALDHRQVTVVLMVSWPGRAGLIVGRSKSGWPSSHRLHRFHPRVRLTGRGLRKKVGAP